MNWWDHGVVEGESVVVDPVTQVELVVPPGISAERVFARERRCRDRELRSIRFFVDWGHAYPLWEDGTGKYTMEPEDYGLSMELAHRLREWCQFFERHLAETGWDTADQKDAWLFEGDLLADALELEVYDFAQVQREFRYDSG
ncbi:hypothetical protein [Frigoribacterium salinisoli]